LFRVMVKPPVLKIISFADGLTGMVIDEPKILSVALASVLEPVADGVESTEDVDPTADATRLKYVISPDFTDRSRLETLDDAVPVPVPVLPLAVSDSRPVVRLTGPELIKNEANPLELLYAGGAAPEAGYSGPTVREAPSTVSPASRTVDELVTDVTAELAGDTTSVVAKPADSPKAPTTLRK
jgi:hypothetical protein